MKTKEITSIESGTPVPEKPFEAIQLPEIEAMKAEREMLLGKLANEELAGEVEKLRTRCTELENLMRLVVSVLNSTLSYAEA